MTPLQTHRLLSGQCRNLIFSQIFNEHPVDMIHCADLPNVHVDFQMHIPNPHHTILGLNPYPHPAIIGLCPHHPGYGHFWAKTGPTSYH